MDALYRTLREKLPVELQNIESSFAVRALFVDSTTPNILGLSASSRPGKLNLFGFLALKIKFFLGSVNSGLHENLPFCHNLPVASVVVAFQPKP